MVRETHLADVTTSMMNDLKVMAIDGFPNEVCGVIHKHHIIHQYPNTFCGDKQHGFDMEIDIKDDDIKAIWHSHPAGPERPSKDDLQAMQQLAEHGYLYPWLIVTNKSVTQWIFQLANSLQT